MTLWLAIIALVVCFVNVCIASTTITETAAWHVNGIESTTTVAGQAQLASVLVFLVRPPRSNPPPTCEPATKTPSEVLPTCNPALRAPKSEHSSRESPLLRAPTSESAYAQRDPESDGDGRRPIAADREPMTDARSLNLSP